MPTAERNAAALADMLGPVGTPKVIGWVDDRGDWSGAAVVDDTELRRLIAEKGAERMGPRRLPVFGVLELDDETGATTLRYVIARTEARTEAIGGGVRPSARHGWDRARLIGGRGWVTHYPSERMRATSNRYDYENDRGELIGQVYRQADGEWFACTVDPATGVGTKVTPTINTAASAMAEVEARQPEAR